MKTLPVQSQDLAGPRGWPAGSGRLVRCSAPPPRPAALREVSGAYGYHYSSADFISELVQPP